MSKLEDALKRLTPEQRALLERKLQEKRQAATRSAPTISPRTDTASHPLSPGQQRLLLQERLIPGTSMFNIIDVLDLRGPLQIKALEQAIGHVQTRHAILRARFTWERNAPVQRIEPAAPYTLPFVDLSDSPEEIAYQEAVQFAYNDYAQPFDLDHTPLLRCRLMKIGAERFIFTVTMHHAVSDGWSYQLFFAELSEAYTAYADGGAPDMEALAIDYADFAAWHTAWLAGEEAQTQRDWWHQYLSGKPRALVLPTDRPAPAAGRFDGASVQATLPATLTEALRTVSVQEEVTPYVLFMTAFNATLFRFTGQHDLIVCSPLAGRRRIEIESLIGYFNNILPFRTRIEDASTFRDIATRIGGDAVDISDRQEVPFQEVAELAPVRRVPLTRAFFTLQDALSKDFTLPGLAIETVSIPTQSTDFDLSLFVELKGMEVILHVDYRTALFSEAGVERLLKAMVRVLEAMTADFHAAMTDLPVFTIHAEGASDDTLPDGASSAEEPADEAPESDVEIVPGSLSRHLMSGDSIPHSVNAALPRQKATQPPTDEVEIALTDIWEKALGIPHIGTHENFFDLGGHSLLAVSIFEKIQARYPDVHLPLAAMLQAPTIASLAQRIRGIGDLGWSPLVTIQAGRNTSPVFCIHGAGGNVLFYRDLAVHMGPDQTVYGLQSQGLDGERPILTTVEAMAERYLEEVLRIQPNGPYYFVGYCLGGTIALEMAQQLRARGREVEILAMLETYNWINARPDTLWSRLVYTVQKIEFHVRNYLQLPGPEKTLFLSEKWAELKRRRRVWWGAIRRAFRFGRGDARPSESNLLAAVWEANDRAAEAYTPTAYPGRIMHFRACKEYSVNRPSDMLWYSIAKEVDTHIMPIYPAGMLIQPFVKQVAQTIRAEIHKMGTERRRRALADRAALPESPAA